VCVVNALIKGEVEDLCGLGPMMVIVDGWNSYKASIHKRRDLLCPSSPTRGPKVLSTKEQEDY
jgi:hypothetical protein